MYWNTANRHFCSLDKLEQAVYQVILHETLTCWTIVELFDFDLFNDVAHVEMHFWKLHTWACDTLLELSLCLVIAAWLHMNLMDETLLLYRAIFVTQCSTDILGRPLCVLHFQLYQALLNSAFRNFLLSFLWFRFPLYGARKDLLLFVLLSELICGVGTASCLTGITHISTVILFLL